MSQGGHTTVIRRVLENRAQPARTPASDTTATVSVMLRVMPPPRLLLSIGNDVVVRRLQKSLEGALVSVEPAPDFSQAARSLDAEPCHLVITDSLELVRRVRKLRTDRSPVVLFVLEVDDRSERQNALDAGADDCISWRADEDELQARIGLMRRIAELETCLHMTLVENRKLSALDELTQLASRRFFIKNFPREVERAGRYGRALSLVVCDIDHFKRINDSLGHAAGDQVLRQFGRRLQGCLRQRIDWVARIGGEEFVIVLPETNAEQALVVANKLRAAIAERRFTLDRGRLAVTASFGVCGLPRIPPGKRKIADEMLKRADAALYRAKHLGRNHVTVAAWRDAEA